MIRKVDLTNCEELIALPIKSSEDAYNFCLFFNEEEEKSEHRRG